MNGYHTEQKKLLLAYLSKHTDEAFTLRELTETLGDCGIGKSTVYRLISRLVEEGAVRRFAREGGGFAYRYLSSAACTSHLHLRCTACGHVIHLAKGAMATMGKLLADEHGFSLDEGRTVLVGLCADCRTAREGARA